MPREGFAGGVITPPQGFELAGLSSAPGQNAVLTCVLWEMLSPPSRLAREPEEATADGGGERVRTCDSWAHRAPPRLLGGNSLQSPVPDLRLGFGLILPPSGCGLLPSPLPAPVTVWSDPALQAEHSLHVASISQPPSPPSCGAALATALHCVRPGSLLRVKRSLTKEWPQQAALQGGLWQQLETSISSSPTWTSFAWVQQVHTGCPCPRCTGSLAAGSQVPVCSTPTRQWVGGCARAPLLQPLPPSLPPGLRDQSRLLAVHWPISPELIPFPVRCLPVKCGPKLCSRKPLSFCSLVFTSG